jgi:hypothetical protein
MNSVNRNAPLVEGKIAIPMMTMHMTMVMM